MYTLIYNVIKINKNKNFAIYKNLFFDILSGFFLFWKEERKSVNLYSWVSTFCLLPLSLRSCLYLPIRPRTGNQEITSLHSVVIASENERRSRPRAPFLDDGIRRRCNTVSTDATVVRGATFELSKVWVRLGVVRTKEERDDLHLPYSSPERRINLLPVECTRATHFR